MNNNIIKYSNTNNNPQNLTHIDNLQYIYNRNNDGNNKESCNNDTSNNEYHDLFKIGSNIDNYNYSNRIDDNLYNYD